MRPGKVDETFEISKASLPAMWMYMDFYKKTVIIATGWTTNFKAGSEVDTIEMLASQFMKRNDVNLLVSKHYLYLNKLSFFFFF